MSVGFTHCTPIQEQSLPLALQGRDVAGQAQTGTGKTAAFLIAMFSLLLRREARRPEDGGSAPRCLIVAPTRELAVQIKDEALLLGRYCDMEIAAVYGGVDYEKQLNPVKSGIDVLVGTPGRLIDYYKQRAFTLDHLEVLVIDEADRMFDMGFIDDIRYMLRNMPPPDRRVSFLYSATLSQRVVELGYEHLNDPTQVEVSPEQVTADNIEQVVYHVGMDEKFSLLLGLLRREQPDRALLFVNTRIMATQLAERLTLEGFKAGALAGDVDQRKRLKLLNGFKDGSISLLVATDVASRGLHIEEVSHVFNYDLPQDAEDYVHRIGRTARAGASGKAISLACERYVYSYEAIEEFVGYSLPFEFPADELLAKPKRWTPKRVNRGGPGGARGGPGGGRGGGRGSGSGSGPGRSPGSGGRQRQRRSAV